jgi:DnaJ-domain-containing protein 1
MTDFFALFNQPRGPWLEPDLVKEKYHQLTRLAHPDARGHETSFTFEDVNEGYRVLSDPRLRIQHLLELEGARRVTGDRGLPEDLQRLFLRIGSLSHRTQQLRTRMAVGSALTLSLMEREILELRSQIEQSLGDLMHFYRDCLRELHELNDSWEREHASAVPQLQSLHDRISYLSRWIAQLREMQFQLAKQD